MDEIELSLVLYHHQYIAFFQVGHFELLPDRVVNFEARGTDSSFGLARIRVQLGISSGLIWTILPFVSSAK